ncbi:hypothetical protein JAAARDRAFT_457843 [Jaapia argillacea MUCL 33604]|uniref:DUF6533 domain-containing protein n=1 Tax=Jaapia argillacea MUCL 33604 TaxID=933084 RepID=A0A067Q5N0_9AGAM|nr:hypothetical protein JAAARDRAFT_457843 [Jaapia argillacea MUCL 33604]
MDAASLAEIETVISDIRTVNYANVASLAWLLYDILLTSEDESRSIWRSRWSLPKVLYLCLRYPMVFTLAFNMIVNANTGWSTEVSAATLRGSPHSIQSRCHHGLARHF